MWREGNTGWCSHYGNSYEVSSRHGNWEYRMIQQFHFCVFIQEKRKTNSQGYVARAGVWGWEVGDMSEGASKGMHFQLSINKTWAVMYSMANTVNNTVLHIWKLLRVNYKSSRHKKKVYLCVWWWVLTRLTVMIILQYVQIWNDWIVCMGKDNIVSHVLCQLYLNRKILISRSDRCLFLF